MGAWSRVWKLIEAQLSLLKAWHVPSTTAPMTWWIFPFFASLDANRAAIEGARFFLMERDTLIGCRKDDRNAVRARAVLSIVKDVREGRAGRVEMEWWWLNGGRYEVEVRSRTQKQPMKLCT